MELTIYQIDAFAEKPFEGNAAAVVPLSKWLPDTVMQSIAAENNLSETAFFVNTNSGFHIRWFTPTKEVQLCGHATLASAYVLFYLLGYEGDQVDFDSLSGPLFVSNHNGLLTLNFPRQVPIKCEAPVALCEGLGVTPVACLKHSDYLAVFEKEEDILAIKPNAQYLTQLDLRGVIVTAPSAHYDFVARFFSPKFGLLEDPVTGSAYTQLTPYWADRLGKLSLHAKQVSARGGELFCELAQDRVLISGRAVCYMQGTMTI